MKIIRAFITIDTVLVCTFIIGVTMIWVGLAGQMAKENSLEIKAEQKAVQQLKLQSMDGLVVDKKILTAYGSQYYVIGVAQTNYYTVDESDYIQAMVGYKPTFNVTTK